MGAENRSAHRSPVRFGPYEVDFDSGELRKNGVRIKLQDQPLRILQLLLDRPGHLIPREELIRQLWPDGTFVDYDHSLNAGVTKLRQALLDSADKPHYIETIGRRGYRFIAEVETQAAPVLPSASRKSGIWVSVFAVIVLGLAATFFYLRQTPKKPTPVRVVPLTSYPGRQITPTFAPDGKQVAFSWDGEKGENFDIYVKMLDASAPLRLTSNPAAEYYPAWSPDNRHVAFCRSVADHFEIWTVPALGGVERKLGESSACGGLSWSPGGKFLALVEKRSSQGPYRLVLLDVESGEKRQLTSPPNQSFGDFDPKFAPDGNTLAFLRASSAVTADAYLLTINGGGSRTGEPLRLTSRERVYDLDWTNDGKTIVFSSDHSGSIGLWTIGTSGGVPEPLPVGSENALGGLSVSRTDNRLVYARTLTDGNVWRVAGPNLLDRNSLPTKLIASTRYDGEAQYSPNGKKIAFNSNRSGNFELWMCDAEGHDCAQLTSLGGPIPGSPRWSPDSHWVAFDCPKAGNSDIYVISIDGGLPRQITKESSADVRPSWSRDGHWIYFGSNRNGNWQIWKSHIDGGQAMQVTKAKGAREAFESVDGKSVYYAKLNVPGIWTIPVEGGEETRVLEQGQMGLWSLGEEGICFFDLTHPAGPGLKFYNFATRKVTVLRQFSRDTRIPTGDSAISVSSDGRSILYTQLDHQGSDLSLVENFR
jgi:Tol biopolymer transport system component/DNA-binding winged helix-turn-helix (wHTH) protein